MKNKVPKLRFPEFSGEWEKKRLKDISIKVNVKNKENTINIVLTNSATQGILAQTDYFDKDIANANNLDGYYIVNKDDFVYNPRISKHAPVGPINKNNLKIGVMSPLYTIFRFNSENLDYISKYFSSRFWHKYMKGIANYGARHDRMNITNSDFFRMPINFPSLPEQEKIANFLSSVDIKIEKLEKKKELLEKYKKGMMQKLFSQKLRFKDDNGNYYPEWEEKRLGEILFEHKEKNKERKILEVFSVAKEKGVINQIEHLGRSFASNDTSNYKIVFENDIVYTKSPTSDFPFGIIKQNMTNRKGIVSTLYAVYKPVNKYIGFLLDLYFKSPINTYNYLNPLVNKGAKNTMNINNSDFLNGAKIKLPVNIKEQEKIANFLSSIDRKIELVEQELEKNKEFKKGLLQQMFV